MSKCPEDCKKHNPFIFRRVVIPAVVDDDTINPPANGAYCNAVVVYEATGNVYLYSSDGIPTSLSSTDYNLLSNLPSINGKVLRGDVTLSDLGISQLIEEEAELRAVADEILQRQIDAITVASDVVDIVGTYEELEEYDTSKLKENDIVKVLSDETIGGATAYYRWVNGAWQYIGQEGPYYTKSQTDALLDQKMDITSLDNYYTKTETNTLLAAKANVSDLANKQDTLIAGSNITIDPTTNVISAIVPSLTNYYTKSETYNTTEVDNLISGVRADIPTNTSDLLNDSGFLTSIPTASSSVLGGIKVGSGLSIAQDGTLSATGTSITVDSALSTTSTNPVENRVITNALNGKANTSDIPTVPTNVSSFYNDAGYLTSTDVASNYYNKSETYTQAQVNALIPTKTSNLVNDGSDGTSTYVEADDLATVATSGSYNDLTDKPSIMTGLVEMSYGESNAWAKFIAAYQAKQIVYCRASSNSNPASGSQTRKAFMAYVNNAENPTEVEFQYVRSVSSKTSSQPVDQVFVYKLTSASGGTWTVQTRDMGPKLAQGTNTTVSYSNGTYTISATQPTVNNATLTIQQNGTNVQTFTANQATNATANITVPTKTSDITNDSDFVSDASYVHTDNNYTTADKNKLAGIAAGAEVNVQANWNEADSSSDAYIQNKPTIGNATLTVQKNGTTLDTFTANATANKTINISVPTKTSDLTNDSGYVVDDGDIACTDTESGFAQVTNPTSHNVAPLSLTHLYGNATQETTTGKNLACTEFNATPASVGGVSITQEDGILKANGTTTGAGSYIFKTFRVPSGSAVFSVSVSGTMPNYTNAFIIEQNDSNIATGWAVAANVSPPNAQVLATLDSAKYYRLRWYVNASGIQLQNVQVKVQLELGSTPTDWEKYTGGVPMPNPEFPSDVNVVSGAQTVRITGKNLFNFQEFVTKNIDVQGVQRGTATYTDNSITLTATGNDCYTRYNFLQGIPPVIHVQKNTDYTLSWKSSQASSPTFKGMVYVFGKNATGGADIIRNSQDKVEKCQFNTGDYDTITFRLGVNTSGDSITYSNIMLEVGDQASDFEPYQGQTQIINLGGTNLYNVFDTTGGTVQNVSTDSDGWITCTIDNTSGTDTQYGLLFTNNLQALETNTTYAIVMEVKNVSGTGSVYPTQGSGAHAQFTSNVSYTLASLSAGDVKIFTQATKSSFASTYEGLRSVVSFSAGQSGSITFRLSVLADTTMTVGRFHYVPYTTYAYELAKIGNYTDGIYPSDGKWYIHKEVGKVVLDGSENWLVANSGTQSFYYYALDVVSNAAPTIDGGATSDLLMSNIGTPDGVGNNNTVKGIFIIIASGQVRVRYGTEMTAQQWQTFLSGTNMTLYYALATPTDTEITDSELVEQLDHIYELYQGTNNLWLIPSAGAQGEITLCASFSQLPVATTQRLGAVIVGDGLEISENGTLSAKSNTYTINATPGAGYSYTPFEGLQFDDSGTSTYYVATRYVSDGYSDDFTVSDSAGEIVPLENLFADKDALLKSTFKFTTTFGTQDSEQVNISIEASPSNVTVTEGYEDRHIIVCGLFSIDELIPAESLSTTTFAPLRWSLFIASDGSGDFTVESIDSQPL